jgi:hypothetical protein
MCGIDQAMQRSNQPIPCSTFNHDGTIFAYGVSMFLPLNCMAKYRGWKIAETAFLQNLYDGILIYQVIIFTALVLYETCYFMIK